MSRRRTKEPQWRQEVTEEIGPAFFDAARGFDYSVRVDCPVCGGLVGVVRAFVGRPEEIEDKLSEHAHADQVQWPERLRIDREIARIRRRPPGPDAAPDGYDTSEWNGRGGRVRATRKL